MRTPKVNMSLGALSFAASQDGFDRKIPVRHKNPTLDLRYEQLPTASLSAVSPPSLIPFGALTYANPSPPDWQLKADALRRIQRLPAGSSAPASAQSLPTTTAASMPASSDSQAVMAEATPDSSDVRPLPVSQRGHSGEVSADEDEIVSRSSSTYSLLEFMSYEADCSSNEGDWELL